MNETGQEILLNAIAYISHFNEDRPIAVTTSVFAGNVARSRAGIRHSLENAEPRAAKEIDPELSAKIKDLDRDQMRTGPAQRDFLPPISDQLLEIDPTSWLWHSLRRDELLRRGNGCPRSGVPTRNAPAAFFNATRLRPENAAAADCAAWSGVTPYLFASDLGDYCLVH